LIRYIDRKPRYWGGKPRFDISDPLGFGSNLAHQVAPGGAPGPVAANIYDDDDDDDDDDDALLVAPSPQAGHGQSVLGRGSVEFKSVHFCYPGRPDVEVLHGIDFSASAPGNLATPPAPPWHGMACAPLLRPHGMACAPLLRHQRPPPAPLARPLAPPACLVGVVCRCC